MKRFLYQNISTVIVFDFGSGLFVVFFQFCIDSEKKKYNENTAAYEICGYPLFCKENKFFIKFLMISWENIVFSKFMCYNYFELLCILGGIFPPSENTND